MFVSRLHADKTAVMARKKSTGGFKHTFKLAKLVLWPCIMLAGWGLMGFALRETPNTRRQNAR